MKAIVDHVAMEHMPPSQVHKCVMCVQSISLRTLVQRIARRVLLENTQTSSSLAWTDVSAVMQESTRLVGGVSYAKPEGSRSEMAKLSVSSVRRESSAQL